MLQNVNRKSQLPNYSMMGNSNNLPQQRVLPIINKEFHHGKIIPEFQRLQYASPQAAVALPTATRLEDDNKGPIHTIPAPNLSLLDKPANPPMPSNDDKTVDYPMRRPESNNFNYHLQGKKSYFILNKKNL